MDYGRRMTILSKEIAELETALGELMGQYTELNAVMGNFVTRYQKEIVPHHNEILRVERNIVDLRVKYGMATTTDRHAGVSRSPLTKFLNVTSQSIEEQVERKGLKERVEHPSAVKEFPPASPEIKALYAEVIARMHPAFARSNEEFEERRKLLIKVNKAYLGREKATLQGLANAYKGPQSNLPAVVDEQAIHELEARIEDLEHFIARLEGLIFDYTYGDMSKVKKHADTLATRGRDYVQELHQELRAYLLQVQRERADLIAQGRMR